MYKTLSRIINWKIIISLKITLLNRIIIVAVGALNLTGLYGMSVPELILYRKHASTNEGPRLKKELKRQLYTLLAQYELTSLGLNEEGIKQTLDHWQESGHRFPDTRFEPIVVAAAIKLNAMYKSGASESELDNEIKKFETNYLEFDYFENLVYGVAEMSWGTLIIELAYDIYEMPEQSFNYIQRLIDLGADLNSTHHKLHITALTALAKSRATAAAKKTAALLLQSGANVDVQDEWIGATALMHAVDCCNNDMVDFLLQSGANVNIQNKRGDTALSYANKLHSGCLGYSKARKREIIALLRQHGAGDARTNRNSCLIL